MDRRSIRRTGLLAGALLLATAGAEADVSCPPGLTITLRSDKRTTFDTRLTYVSGAGNEAVDPSAIQGGDTLCVQAHPGGTSFGLLVRNLAESPGISAASPITLVNSGGQVVINGNGDAGIELHNSRYVRVTGTGSDAHLFGFKVDGGFAKGVAIRHRTSDVEIDHIEIAHVAQSGISASPKSNCSDSSRPQGQTWDDMYDFDGDGFYQKGRVVDEGPPLVVDPGDVDDVVSQSSFTLTNLRIHHNYVHDTGTEGMYLGSNRAIRMVYPNGTPGPGQGEDTICTYTDDTVVPPIVATGDDNPLNPKIVGLEVYRNRVERSGWDAVNVKSSARDCRIHDNLILDFSTANAVDQRGGINLIPDVVCDIARNVVVDGNGTGIYSMGSGGLVAANLVVRAGGGSAPGATGTAGIHLVSSSLAWPELYDGYRFAVVNNTIVSANSYGVHFGVGFETTHVVANNLVVETLAPDPGGDDPSIEVSSGATAFVTANAYFGSTIDPNLALADPAADDYRLTAASVAADQGIDPASAGVEGSAIVLDLDGIPRPQEAAFDLGAFELAPDVIFTNGFETGDLDDWSATVP